MENQMGNPSEGQNTQGQPLDLSPLMKDGKLLGKYDDPKALADGYWNAVQEMNNAKQQVQTAAQIIQHLQAQGQPQQPATNASPAYEARLNELGIPTSELSQLVDARAQRIAEKLFEQHFNPLVKGAQARSEMAESYPDFVEHEQAIMANTRSNPFLAKQFEALVQAGEPRAALELGYLHWLKNKQPTPNPDTEAARRAAQTPSGAGAVNRTAGLQASPTEGQLQAAYNEYWENGNAVPLFNLKMGSIPLTYTEQMEALLRGRQ